MLQKVCDVRDDCDVEEYHVQDLSGKEHLVYLLVTACESRPCVDQAWPNHHSPLQRTPRLAMTLTSMLQ